MCHCCICKYYILTCLNRLFEHSNPHIPKVASNKAKTIPTGYGKSLGLGDICVKVQLRQADTVLVLRLDATEPMMFDLNKPSDFLTLKEILEGDTEGLLGWKVIQRHKEDRDTAKALAIASDLNPATPEMGEGKNPGSFVHYFTPPSSLGSSKEATSAESGETNKNKGKNIFDGNDGDGGVTEAVWSPKPDMLKGQLKKVSTKQGVQYYVSFAFRWLYESKISYLVVVEVPREAWFIHSGHPLTLFELKSQDLKYDMPGWQASFTETAIRKCSYGENEYKRRNTGKGNSVGRTINKITFVFTIKVSEEPMFHQMLLSAFQKFERLYHPAAQPGASILTYMQENSPGIVDYFHKQYPDDDKLEAYLHQTLVDCFSRKRNVVLDCHLDRFLMDNSIKEFLQDTGVNGWNEVANMDRVYKNWPKAIMQWDNIEHKPYDE
jgi:hypothetical protein